MPFVFFAYLISFFAYFIFLSFKRDFWQKAGFFLLSLAFIFHGLFLFKNYLDSGFFPFFDLASNLSSFAFIFAGLYIFIRPPYHIKVLGFFVSLILALITCFSSFIPSALSPPEPVYKSFWVFIHVVSSFTANSAFALAFVVGLLYIFLEKGIKKKRKDIFFKRLPSLELLDATIHLCISIGFFFITLGVITGFFYAKLIWGHFWSWDPKELSSLIICLIYAVLLHGRLSSGWKGRKAASMAVLAFLLLLFTFLGTNFILTGHHGDFTRILR